MDTKLAKENMIKQQLKTWGVLDKKVLQAISTIPRENFVPDQFKNIAYSDARLPLEDTFMLTPEIVGKICQSLNLKHSSNVLEIGTGSGYLTAVLAKLCNKVISFELSEELAKNADRSLRELDIYNVKIENREGFSALSEKDMFDAVIVTGAIPYVSEQLRYQLNIDGKLFAFVGQSPATKATIITRVSDITWKNKFLFETDIPYMKHFKQEEKNFNLNSFLE